MIAGMLLCLLVCTVYRTRAEVDIITQPRPGEEYVLVSSEQQTPLRNFETLYKTPTKKPQHRMLKLQDGNERISKKMFTDIIKHPAEGVVAIEEDKKETLKKGLKVKVSESIEIEVPVSKLEDVKIKEHLKDMKTNPKMAVDLEAISKSRKLRNASGTTTQKPILTTASPATNKGFDYIPINFDIIDDIDSGLLLSNVKLETAGSEQKQHSRIEIKKGPNGQNYEYEYVYYYYDDEDGKKEKSTTAASVYNSHDGTQKSESDNQIAKKAIPKSKYSSIERSNTTTLPPTPENQNEVTQTSSRGRARGRTVAPAAVLKEDLDDIRLPSSTRFPLRGRNLVVSTSTTYVPEVSSDVVNSRGRAQADNVADESIGQTRSRTRSHIRRPSSELVDLDSFKTHSRDIPFQYREPSMRHSTKSKETFELPEAVPSAQEPSHTRNSLREGHYLSRLITFQEVFDGSKLPSDYKTSTSAEQDTTECTTMTAMEKAALDLYAYLARENLNNEVNHPTDFDGTPTMYDESYTTEAIGTTVDVTIPTTTTTTTTTTTPAPTTTTTMASTRPSRFKGRLGAKSRVSTTSAATESPQETSTIVRGRFSKPSIGGHNTSATTEPSTVAPVSEKAAIKQVFSRRGLFAWRTRPFSTTAAPPQDSSSAATEKPAAPRTRLRPSVRRTTTTTAAPTDDSIVGGETAETTPAPARTIGRGRPEVQPAAALRPGARLNLRANPKLRPSATSTVTDTADQPSYTTALAENPATDAEREESSPTPTPEQLPRGGLKLRRLQVAPSPKPKTPVTQPPRRPNPLLKRKLSSTEATTEAAKKESSVSTEENNSAEKSETETEEQPVEATAAAPLRGLDALFARRRAVAAGGIAARPTRLARAAPKPT